MPEIFDMITGSETGAIIASTLVVKNDDSSSAQENKYWARDASTYFVENIDTLYIDSQMSTAMKGLFVAIFLIIFGTIAYKTAEAYFRNDLKDKRILELK